MHTHHTLWAEILHKAGETLLLPARWHMQSLAKIVVPLPGAHKESSLKSLTSRVCAIALAILTLLPALVSVVIAFPLRMISHRYRPAIGFIHSPSSQQIPLPSLTPEQPLHIRSHNVALVTNTMSTLGDLRNPLTRAQEIADSLKKDPHQPDIICFQEAFHEEASHLLCDQLKHQYPYIIHSVAPHVFGFNSGHMIASKYPLEQVDFHRFSNMIGPETASPRGILRVKLKTASGTPLLLYAVHLQASLGEARATARHEQLTMIHQMMKNDKITDSSAMQILVGDFNIAHITPWGDDLLKPAGQSEEKNVQALQSLFEDLYLKDHDPATGKRTKGSPYYLSSDNQLLSQSLVEPSASWYSGPLKTPPLPYKMLMKKDLANYKRPLPQKSAIPVTGGLWGTTKWKEQQPATTSRFDYVLLPKEQGPRALDGLVEIRRSLVPPSAQSASSDHLPVDARLWIKKGSPQGA